MRRLARLIAPAAVVLATMAGAGPAQADEVLIGLAAPLTGPMAWAGASTQRGFEMAVADLNQAGGILNEQIQIVAADDYCDADQAVAAATRLIEAEVEAVFGHECSGAALATSKMYDGAGILLISTFATNPLLTEQGLSNVFRVIGRDDQQGKIAADLVAERFPDAPIAILHDGGAYGKGLAEQVRHHLAAHGIEEVLFEPIEAGGLDYSSVLDKIREAAVEILYYGGYVQEVGLLARQAYQRGYDLQLIAGDGVGTEDFALIADAGAEGTLFTYPPNPRMNPEAAPVATEVARRPGEEGPFTTYAAVQAWAQAVEHAGTFDAAAVAGALRSHKFDTVLGRIGFDDKGDITGYETFVWYQWRGGDYEPVDPGQLTE